MPHTVNSSVAIASVPFLIRKLNVLTTGAAEDTAVHGGPAVEPDIVLTQLSAAGDVGGMAVTAKSTTTITLDPETSGDVCDVYCIWFAQADGGITA